MLLCCILYRNSIQGYTTCPVELAGNICNLSFTEFFTYPIVGYGIWQVIYYVWVSQEW